MFSNFAWGAYSKGRLIQGGLKFLLAVDQIPVEIFQLINSFFDAALTSNTVFFER